MLLPALEMFNRTTWLVGVETDKKYADEGVRRTPNVLYIHDVGRIHDSY
jgi:hypothetical protein